MTEQLTIAERLRDAVWNLCEEMEQQRLTKIELNFKNDWKVILENPKRHRILMKGGEPYPETTQNKEKESK